jgi:hypothetical protein
MNRLAFLWIALFFLSTGCFFIVAGIVAVKGFQDLLDLLRNNDDQSD